MTVGERDEHHETALAFHEGGNRAHLLGEDQVAVPVSRHSTVVGFGGTLPNVDGAAELTLAVHHRMAARPTSGVTPSQVAGEFLTQCATGLHGALVSMDATNLA